MSRYRYPRKGEYGEPTYKCRWCGKERQYDATWYLIKNYCSVSCYSAHLFYPFVFSSILFGYISWLIVDSVGISIFEFQNRNMLLMLGIVGFVTVIAVGCSILGYLVRKSNPHDHRIQYKPDIRA